eukprot:TRINITY_DN7693_c0_g1_i1.p1 TRINITY_DN7693_c0_g1~~TRINITY_DN7693_c0_g1_i1.p1  ORF type:complete len:341 (+),score=46.75 TRINITY_DN7693_c0_g1_i1:7-1029(+)
MNIIRILLLSIVVLVVSFFLFNSINGSLDCRVFLNDKIPGQELAIEEFCIHMDNYRNDKNNVSALYILGTYNVGTTKIIPYFEQLFPEINFMRFTYLNSSMEMSTNVNNKNTIFIFEKFEEFEKLNLINLKSYIRFLKPDISKSMYIFISDGSPSNDKQYEIYLSCMWSNFIDKKQDLTPEIYKDCLLDKIEKRVINGINGEFFTKIKGVENMVYFLPFTETELYSFVQDRLNKIENLYNVDVPLNDELYDILFSDGNVKYFESIYGVDQVVLYGTSHISFILSKFESCVKQFWSQLDLSLFSKQTNKNFIIKVKDNQYQFIDSNDKNNITTIKDIIKCK